MKTMSLCSIIAFSFLWMSCNNSSFSGNNKDRKGSDIKVPPSPKETPDEGDPGTGGNACPPAPQSLLIIDLKSGWWSGDGGDYFKAILGSISNPDCADQLSVEYHHIIKQASFTVATGSSCETSTLDLSRAPNESVTFSNKDGRCELVKSGLYIDTRLLYPEKTDAFYSEATFSPSLMNEAAVLSSSDKTLFIKEIAQYTQIWLLSGSEGDNLDFPVSHPFFTELLSKITLAKVPLFIGAGFGSISHANALTNKLSLGDVFSTNIPIAEQGDIVDLRLLNSIQNTISIESRSDIPANQSSHALFTNVTSIADKMLYVEKQRDGIAKDPAENISIASDTLTSVTALVGDMIGTSTHEGKNVVFDAGMQRFYSIHADSGADTQTLTYLQNIALFLSQ